MELISLNVGKTTSLLYNRKTVESGILKFPAEKSVFLSKTGFTGDEQADLVHHGGEDKAVCVYASEHFPYWEEKLGQPMVFGAFGENMTVKGLLETDIHIGDIFHIGEAIVQISQPRQPCFKLAARYKKPKLPLLVQETGFTGFYFRVLKEGTVHPGDRFICEKKHPLAITIAFANQIMYERTPPRHLLQQLLAVEELAESWRAPLSKKLFK